MHRSDFIKLSCGGCLLSAAGLISIASLLEGCSPKAGMAIYKTDVVNKQLSVPVSRLAAGKVTIVRGKGMDYDVAVHETGMEAYEALLLRCTHFSNPLVIEGNTYSCPVHGSRFGSSGEVKNGPASQPLRKLKCQVSGGVLLISV